MSSKEHSQPVLIYSPVDADKLASGSIRVRTLSFGERIKNGLVMLMACWIIAAFCILIPVMHFFLVPGGFVLGLILYRDTGWRSDGPVVCPSCQSQIQLNHGTFRWPIREICPGCRTNVFISTD